MLDFTWDPPTRNPGKPWKWILIDSAIIAAIAAVASLPETRLPTATELYTALRAFLYSFLVQLAVERGYKAYVHKKAGNAESRGG
jgi:hypothetical protein